MNISKIKTAKKVANFSLRLDNNPNKIKCDFLKEISLGYLNDSSPRVYLLTVDNIITKIGGSQQKGGIKGTMSFYVNAMQGSPGVARFVVHLLIHESLRNNQSVELFMIRSEKVLTNVPGLFKFSKIYVSGFKEMESLCKQDYYNIEKKYPIWNFQENGESYPKELSRLHNEYHQSRLK